MARAWPCRQRDNVAKPASNGSHCFARRPVINDRNMNWKKVRRGVAGYGVAMASLSLTHYADAGIIDVSANLGGPVPYVSSTAFRLLGGAVDFVQFNDTTGKTIFVRSDIAGIRSAPFSNVITTGMTFKTSFSMGTSASGTKTFGFITTGNQVGWIKMNLGGLGGDITYLAAAYNDTPGGNILSGTFSTVPEPSTAALTGLGALALGAVSLRKMRRQRTAAQV